MLKMPWTLNDYPSSFKNFEKAKKKKAIDISNALIEEGYRENQAIPIAIEQAKEWYDNANEDDRESYLKQGEVTKHDHKYESNPELLDENRSEEHTSELQSRGHLVCRLLLEKKNT